MFDIEKMCRNLGIADPDEDVSTLFFKKIDDDFWTYRKNLLTMSKEDMLDHDLEYSIMSTLEACICNYEDDFAPLVLCENMLDTIASAFMEIYNEQTKKYMTATAHMTAARLPMAAGNLSGSRRDLESAVISKITNEINNKRSSLLLMDANDIVNARRCTGYSYCDFQNAFAVLNNVSEFSDAELSGFLNAENIITTLIDDYADAYEVSDDIGADIADSISWASDAVAAKHPEYNV